MKGWVGLVLTAPAHIACQPFAWRGALAAFSFLLQLRLPIIVAYCSPEDTFSFCPRRTVKTGITFILFFCFNGAGLVTPPPPAPPPSGPAAVATHNPASLGGTPTRRHLSSNERFTRLATEKDSGMTPRGGLLIIVRSDLEAFTTRERYCRTCRGPVDQKIKDNYNSTQDCFFAGRKRRPSLRCTGQVGWGGGGVQDALIRRV